MANDFSSDSRVKALWRFENNLNDPGAATTSPMSTPWGSPPPIEKKALMPPTLKKTPLNTATGMMSIWMPGSP